MYKLKETTTENWMNTNKPGSRKIQEKIMTNGQKLTMKIARRSGKIYRDDHCQFRGHKENSENH